MGDRTYVTVAVDGLDLDVNEWRVYRQLCGGEEIDPNAGSEPTEDETCYQRPDGTSVRHFGQPEVSVGYIRTHADDIVSMMHSGILTGRSFSVNEDCYNDEPGWLVQYDAETDVIVEGPEMGGSFIVTMESLLYRYEKAHRNAEAMIRQLFEEYNVRLPSLPSPVVALISRLNQQKLHT